MLKHPRNYRGFVLVQRREFRARARRIPSSETVIMSMRQAREGNAIEPCNCVREAYTLFRAGEAVTPVYVTDNRFLFENVDRTDFYARHPRNWKKKSRNHFTRRIVDFSIKIIPAFIPATSESPRRRLFCPRNISPSHPGARLTSRSAKLRVWDRNRL